MVCRACVDLNKASAEASIKAVSEEISSKLSGSQWANFAPDFRAYECDVTDESTVVSTWADIVNDFGKVDCLVTAAGIVDNVAAEDYGYDRWKKMIDINLHGSFLFAKQAGSHMLKEKIRGSIIFMSSMSAFICVRPQKQAAYNASKGAVSMMMKSLATEWGPHGIRVNSLAPGYMKTDLIRELLQKDGRGLEEQWAKDVPLGRMGTPHELRGTIVYMASDASSYLNGSDVIVDGGYTAW
ncbi:MAG: hypothetical protein M1833_003174 [Piccolia ochrophora]|nr:MAG: hypothetical protein M1833_003174 [Piccolia ochrophora]